MLSVLTTLALHGAAFGADYDGDFYVITPHSTGMLGSFVYDVFYDEIDGRVWIAADDPVWDEGGIASTLDGLTWDTYSNVNEEVPTNLVQELRRGPDGALWMASDVGLLRFDGITAEVVWDENNATVWPHSGVTDFDWDSQGNLWVSLSEVATVFGGVAKYDGASWTLYNSANGSIPWTKPWDNVVTLDIDSTDRVWVGNSVIGAAMFDGTKWTWFPAQFGSLPSGWVNELLVEDDGTAWFGTMGGGISRLQGKTWTTWNQTTGPIGTNDIANIALDNDGDVWITTFIGAAWEFTGVGQDWVRTGVPLGHVYGLDFDASNQPLAGGIGGLVWSDGQLITPYAVNLSNRWLDAIHEDANRHMWIGGGGGGVTRYDGTTWMSFNPDNEGIYTWPFATDAVEDIEEGLDGHIFVNAINHGIGEWDGATWIEHIGTQSIEVMDIAPDGTLWAGPMNGTELVTYDGISWDLVPFPFVGFGGDIYAMAVDPVADVWVGTLTGLYHTADAGLTWTQFTMGNSGLPSNSVFSLAAEPDGSGIWIGTADGLAFYDGVDWTEYTMANSGLPADVIDVVEIAHDGSLWVGAFDGNLFPYDGGLARFDGTTWRTWTEENSNIPHEQIWSIEVDLDGNVWVGTASEGIGLLSVDSDGADTFVSSPLAWKPTKGPWLSGDTLSLAFDDANDLWFGTVPKGQKLVTAATIDLQTHVAAPSEMAFAVDVIADGQMGVTFALRNIVTGTWDPIGPEVKVSFVDASADFVVPGAPADYVEPGTGLVKMKVSGQGSAAKNPFGVSLGIDLIEMTVTE